MLATLGKRSRRSVRPLARRCGGRFEMLASKKRPLADAEPPKRSAEGQD